MSTDNENPKDLPIGPENPGDEPIFSRTACQLGILVLDGSGSMTEIAKDNIPKHQAVNVAVKETIQRIAGGNQKNNIDLCIIKFGQEAEVVSDIASVANMDPMGSYDPLIGGNTYIKKGLKLAEEKASTYLQKPPVEGLPTNVVIVVLTDGMFSEDPKEVVDKLKQNNSIKINACFFGAQPDEKAINWLKSICTDPVNGYLTTYNTEQIRKFFIASVSSIK
jgi:uncharacterized protein YegL